MTRRVTVIIDGQAPRPGRALLLPRSQFKLLTFKSELFGAGPGPGGPVEPGSRQSRHRDGFESVSHGIQLANGWAGGRRGLDSPSRLEAGTVAGAA